MSCTVCGKDEKMKEMIGKEGREGKLTLSRSNIIVAISAARVKLSLAVKGPSYP